MKTIEMRVDYDYCPMPQLTIAYKAGHIYTRVPNAAADAILAAGAGRVVGEDAEQPEVKARGRRR